MEVIYSILKVAIVGTKSRLSFAFASHILREGYVSVLFKFYGN